MSERLYTAEDVWNFYLTHCPNMVKEDERYSKPYPYGPGKKPYHRSRYVSVSEFLIITVNVNGPKSTRRLDLSKEWFQFLVSKYPEKEDQLIKVRDAELRRKAMRPEDHLIGFIDKKTGKYYKNLNEYYDEKETQPESSDDESTIYIK